MGCFMNISQQLIFSVYQLHIDHPILFSYLHGKDVIYAPLRKYREGMCQDEYLFTDAWPPVSIPRICNII